MANHIYTIEIGNARTHYLWRSGYLQTVGGIRVENEPIYLGENPEIIIPAGDTIAIYEYRSMVSFTNEELGAVPTIASITKAFSIMLNRAVDPAGLQHYTQPSYTNLQSVIVEIGFSDEYRLITPRVYGYPMQLNNLDGTIVARMDDYENYINSQPDLLDYYNNPANNWGYDWGAAVEPVQSRSKAEFGESHFAVAGSLYGNTLLSYTSNEAKSVSYQPSNGLFLQGTNIISIVDSASNTLSSRQTSIEQIRSKMNEVINQGNQSVSIGTEPTDPKSGDTWFDGNSLKIYIGLELSTEDGNSTISTEDGFQDLDLELASPWLELGGSISSSSTESLAPTASIVPYAGSSAPTGYLLCDGAAKSRTTYATLYAALGGADSPYGQGDGSTTFNIPDLQGRVIAGHGGTLLSGSADAIGATNAHSTKTHTLSIAEMPAHDHTYNRTTNVTAGGPAAIEDGPVVGAATSSSTGGGGAHNNVQPTIILNYIIKT